LLDGKATRPDGGSAAQLIPPLFGLEGVGLVTWNSDLVQFLKSL
jgi:hypothetical protein